MSSQAQPPRSLAGQGRPGPPIEDGQGRPEPRLIGRKVLRPREQVEDMVRSAILGGDLRSGERLPSESELARQFDVSRNTVREALHALATQNLIYKVPGAGGGSFVRSVDHESLGETVSDAMQSLLALGRIEPEEVAMVRQYLEVPSVREAARHRTAEDLAHLHDVVARQVRASVDDPAVIQLDAQFHVGIATASGNRVLSSLVAALHQQTEPVRYLNLSPEVGQVTVRQHQAILKAIEEQDAEAGEEAIVAHLTYLRQHLRPQA